MTKHKPGTTQLGTTVSLGQWNQAGAYVEPVRSSRTNVASSVAGTTLTVRGNYSVDDSGQAKIHASANLKAVDRKLGVREMNNRLAGRISNAASTIVRPVRSK